MDSDLPTFINQVIQDMWVKMDVSKVDVYYTNDYVGYEKGISYDREALKCYVKEHADRYQQPSCLIEDVLIDNNKVALRFVYRAINTKTNELIVSHGISIWHLRGNKIAKGWISTEPPLED